MRKVIPNKTYYLSNLIIVICLVFIVLYGFQCNLENRLHIVGNGNVRYFTCNGVYELKDSSYGTIKVINRNYLRIEHKNAILNCFFDTISIKYEVYNHNIYINETHINPNFFNTCKYDLEYIIGPFDIGTYNIIINDTSKRINRFNFEFDFEQQIKNF